jgi:phenylpyruvate tautomerase PptA (4-oxalocrotonate tautomerase family)
MPLVNISLRRGRDAQFKLRLLGAVHDALVRNFRIPDGDRAQRIGEFAPEDFQIPEGKSEQFTIIELTVFAGRSRQAKAGLYRDIVGGLVELGIPVGDVLIVLHEPPADNWGVRGGRMASEVELGFKLDV